MRITAIGTGSRGDMQPMLALALGLRAAGHDVRFATHRDFEAQVREHRLEFIPLSGKSKAFFGGRAGVAFRDRLKTTPQEYARFFDSYMIGYMKELRRDEWAACQDVDAVIGWPWMQFALAAAEKLGTPIILASVLPTLYSPTRAFANPYQGRFRDGGTPEANLRTWQEAPDFFHAGSKHLMEWRRELGLPIPEPDAFLDSIRQLPHVFGFSSHVLPRPDDWAENMHVGGYWFLDHPPGYRPSEELTRFLEAGAPPVVIGFGSQVGTKPRELTEAIVGALRRAGKRAIFITGFGGIRASDLPDQVFKTNNIPYDWLLPRVAGVIHQGGSGSTSATLRAGRGAMAVTFGYDQPLWGQRIYDLGVGAAPIDVRELTIEALAEGIVQVAEDTQMHQRAAALGELIRAEDGVGRSVTLIEEMLGV